MSAVKMLKEEKSVNKSMSSIRRTEHLMQLPVMMSKNTLRVVKSRMDFTTLGIIISKFLILTLRFFLLIFPFLQSALQSMEEDIESEPLDLKNLPAIVNGQLVRVSVLYSREYSREKSNKSWEDNGDCSPLHATIKGLLVRVSLQFQDVDVDKSCETSDVALKSTKKWNF